MGILGLTIQIKGDTKDLDSALSDSKGSVGGFGSSIAGTAAKLLPMAAVATGAAVALGAMANAAAEDEAQQVKLAGAIAAATGSTADHTAEVDAAIAAGQELAFTDSQTRDALQSLVTSTGDLSTATAMLGTAQDVARFAGVDLATASDAIAKANEGQDGALRKLIPGLEKGATATDTIANAQKAAAGQAAAYSNTTEAGMAKASDAVGELGETVGSALLPALQAILPAIIPVIKSLGTLISAILPVIIPLIKLLGQALAVVAGILTTVVGWLVKLIDWLKTAITWVGNMLSKLGPLKDIGSAIGGILGHSTSAGVAAATMGRSGRSGSSSSSAPVTINITATGDSLATEQAVLRALRRSSRINGGTVPGWAG